jgi:hypothetical protein
MEVIDAINDLIRQVDEGSVTTLKKARAILGLQGISFNENSSTGNQAIDRSARILRIRLLGIVAKSGGSINLALSDLKYIDANPAHLKVLRDLKRIEDKYRETPFFPKIRKRINAIKLIKRQELIKYLRKRLHKLTEQYNRAEALQFKIDFFGTRDEIGCGLAEKDLSPSPSERMTLHRIRAENWVY